MTSITQISSYKKDSFTAVTKNGKSITHDIYTLGKGTKTLILIQELPGIGQETLALADQFVQNGYTVVLPHLFGPIGKTDTFRNLLRVFCMRREFKLFAANKSSPVVDYLSALCSEIKQKYNVKGVAVIGMCLTGNFAISLMANDAVLAGFASQPSLPLTKQSAIHISQQEIELIKNKLDTIGPMHCGRFEGDTICSAKKFNTIDQTFNTDNKKRIILHQLPGKGHSILTLDFVDKEGHPTKKAFNIVLNYFDEHLS